MKKYLSILFVLALCSGFLAGIIPQTTAEAAPSEQVGVGLVRFGNATVMREPVQVQVDNVFVANKLYDVVGYFSFNSGEHTVIFRAENGGAEIARTTFNLQPATRMTVVMTGSISDPQVMVVNDDNQPTVRGEARYRILNALPESSGENTSFGGETLGTLAYGEVTDEIVVRAGSYNLSLGNTNFDVVLSPGRYYLFTVVGENSGDARLLTWMGRPYRVSGFNRFRFMNLVTAEDGEAPEYTVYVNDDPQPAYQNVDFGQATNEIVVQPGSYSFEVYNQGEALGSTTPVSDLQIDIAENQSIFMVATGTPGDVSLNIFSENVNPVPVNTARLQVVNFASNIKEFGVKGPNDVMLIDQAPFGSVVSEEIAGGLYDLQLVDPADTSVRVGRAEVNAPSGSLATLIVYDDVKDGQRWVWFNEPLNQVGIVRVVHAARDAGPVDIYLDDTQILRDFDYRAATDYITVDPGNYTLRLYPAGSNVEEADPIWSDNVRIEGNDLAFTIVALGKGDGFRVNSYADNLELIPDGQARVRFINAMSGVEQISFINAANGGTLAGGLFFGQGTDNLNLEANTRTFNVNQTGVGPIYRVQSFELVPGAYYTWVFVGEGTNADNVDTILLERLP